MLDIKSCGRNVAAPHELTLIAWAFALPSVFGKLQLTAVKQGVRGSARARKSPESFAESTKSSLAVYAKAP
jgi:hypothetical protein